MMATRCGQNPHEANTLHTGNEFVELRDAEGGFRPNGESLLTSTQPQEGVHVALTEDVPPNGGYGWVCTVCTFLINANTWGVASIWGVILNHYISHKTFHEGSHLQYALIAGLSVSQALIISPVVGASRKYLGARATNLIGTAVQFGALFGASYATRVWHLFLTQGVFFGWGMGVLFITSNTLLPPWFSSRRSLAVGIATSGVGLGGLAYSLAAGRVVPTLGVPWCYRIVSFSSLACNLLSSVLLRDRGAAQSRRQQHQKPPFDYAAFTRIEVLLIVFWGVVTELGYMTLFYSLPSYASSIGLSASQGALANALLNLGLGVGRPIVGYYSDRLGRINMALGMTLLCAVLCLALWIPAQSYGPLAAFAVLAGAVCGTFWGTIAPVLVEVVGLREMAGVFGVICFALVLPTTFAEPIAMQLVGVAGVGSGYLAAQIFVGVMFMLGALSVWILRSWMIFQIEKKAANERAENQGVATVRRVNSKLWLTPRRMFMLRRV
ncbi:putative MFS transporter [Macrophomina phaseolina]|uniref:MFS transporter n=1 Tax=Macrophomina phaseolina TaxID=35725 RepID=A0ABQ8G4E8_9PEZI|nr:putative MFS transporter [Macrophomina phaseolina]